VLTLLISLSIIVISSASTCNNFSTLYTFNQSEVESYGARCLDGSPYAFYYRSCPGNNANKVVIWLQGGGYCVLESPFYALPNCSSRVLPVGNPLGSSVNYTSTTTHIEAILQFPQASNPDFYDWNFVFLPYCSGDLWSGTRTSTQSGYGGDYWITGHNNLLAVKAKLIEWGLWDTLTDIVFGGESAGGLGVSANIDVIRDTAPAGAQVATYVAAGWFIQDLPFPGTGAYNATTTLELIAGGAQAYVNQECAQNVYDDVYPAAYQCLEPNTSFPLWRVRTFIAQNVYDTYQLDVQSLVPAVISATAGGALACAFVRNFGQTLIDTMYPIIYGNSNATGIWAPACLSHATGGTGAPGEMISNVSEIQLFGDWYNQQPNAQFPNYKAVDPCISSQPSVIQCNPTCPVLIASAYCNTLPSTTGSLLASTGIGSTTFTPVNGAMAISHAFSALAFIIWFVCLV